jgi:hypothetical protein
MIAVCCSSQLACHDPRLAVELVEVLCPFNKGLSPVCSSNTGPSRHPQHCDNDGMWDGDASTLAAIFDVTEDEAHDVLGELCDGHHSRSWFRGNTRS